MANYYGKARTNYFTVSNKEKFEDIVGRCGIADGEIEIIDDGNEKYGFMCDGSILGLPDIDEDNLVNDESEGDDYEDDYDYSYGLFCKELQGVIPEGEAIIITEIGSEKMRYLTGFSSIITKNQMSHIDLRQVCLSKARELLGDNNYDTQMEY